MGCCINLPLTMIPGAIECPVAHWLKILCPRSSLVLYVMTDLNFMTYVNRQYLACIIKRNKKLLQLCSVLNW